MKKTKKAVRPDDAGFISECIFMARKGAGKVEPNPLVGALVVKKGKIIGRGYHRKYGGPHAEINALRACRKSARGATLYVNIEPCAHQGKTPPCTDAIIDSGIREVVVGMNDPNPLVAGRGLRTLKKAGISVKKNVLREECERLNESYMKYITTGLPFVTLKIAQTADGRVADIRGLSRWITNDYSRVDVHHLRSQSAAVLAGAGTIVADDPRLTVRHVPGSQPLRVVLDGKLSVSSGARVFMSLRKNPTLLVTTSSSLKVHKRKVSTLRKKGVTIIAFDVPRSRGVPVKPMLRVLGEMGITSVMVEGGAETWGRFLNERCADKIILYTAPLLIGGGLRAFSGLTPATLPGTLGIESVTAGLIGDDLVLEGYVSYKNRRP